MKFVENIQAPMYGVSEPVEPSFEGTFMTPNFALSHEVKQSDEPFTASSL